MIFGSSLQVPAEKTKFLRLTAKELLKSYNRRTYHLREVGDGLVAAEGEEEFFKLLEGEVTKRQMKLLLSIIWLSLTTYAWEDYDSICGAFYNGLYYLEEAL